MAGDFLIPSDGSGNYEFEETASVSDSGETAVSMQMARRLTNDDSSVSVSFGVSMFSE